MRSYGTQLSRLVLRRCAPFAACGSAVVALALPTAATAMRQPVMAQTSGSAHTPAAAPGVPFTAEKLVSLLPATVYFQGRTASLQVRNAGGTSFEGGAIVWAALVDSSGYASNVQDRYQFYLVTECPLRVGAGRLAPGAYGGGVVGDHFILMDLGGHTIADEPAKIDAALARPRPLQLIYQSGISVKLLLGRRWITLQTDSLPVTAR